ncbi:uncharacterized protein LOC131671377 [Phymastichus coffea]|uniref:uncharacterized protein LOC131671377 n=1 Tax=Phymastichus coffea TaxID=108790 RepID=UPI00273BAB67|nr:uncharacterized protein LOC131671377 [Phymastichus coffea]
MAVANVGGNAINLQVQTQYQYLDDELANVTPISEITPPYLGSPEPPSPVLQRCPSIDNQYFVPEYGIDDPGAEERRRYLRERGKYIDPFAQLHRPPVETEECFEPPDTLPAGLFDDGSACPQQAAYSVPRRQPYEYLPCDAERLQRFFDLENYPPQPPPQRPSPTPGAPPGRECLPSDLWDLDDPWYLEADEPDLIQF